MFEQWLSRTKNRSRSISAENVYGEKGKGGMAEVSSSPQEEVLRIGQFWGLETGKGPARELGQKWKVRPCITLPPETVTTLMDIASPGIIRHIWITTKPEFGRSLILRMYWDDETFPSVEVPLGDFFCNAPSYTTEINSIPINVAPSYGYNSFFPMPFSKRARITLENLRPEPVCLFYTIDYEETVEADENLPYFHASFRRENPVSPDRDFTIIDNIRGEGHYAGCYLAWQQNNSGWWGEGEVKMFLDGDRDFPTICGTGTEDYFLGAWNFGGRTFSAPFSGHPYSSACEKPGARHSLYRFHQLDPVHFAEDLKVTIQALGWRSEGRFLPLQDDISATAYWYQFEPHVPLKSLPDRNNLEII